jgi:predicted GNAT family N-acyltransferase
MVSVQIRSWRDAALEAARIRELVFVREQAVPAEIELDEWDDRCDHALAFTPNGAAIGTGRLLPDGHIGRMAVLREWRGRGVGAALMTALIDRARSRGMSRVLLNAQTHAASFYARFGFTAFGSEFMEAGIPHIAMERTL